MARLDAVLGRLEDLVVEEIRQRTGIDATIVDAKPQGNDMGGFGGGV